MSILGHTGYGLEQVFQQQLRVALVVDDSRVMRELIGGVLRQAGLDVVEATDGAEALERLRGGRPIDAALIDQNMPRMDGRELLSWIRRDPRTADIPILVVTGETDSARTERLLKAGANDCLAKPFTPDALMEKLKVLGVLG